MTEGDEERKQTVNPVGTFLSNFSDSLLVTLGNTQTAQQENPSSSVSPSVSYTHTDISAWSATIKKTSSSHILASVSCGVIKLQQLRETERNEAKLGVKELL